MYLYLEHMRTMTMGERTLSDCKYNLVKFQKDHKIIENDTRKP